MADDGERKGLRAWLANAFSMDAYQEPLTERELAMLERVARTIVVRGMTVPALLFLEMGKPLNYIGSQTLAFFEPIVRSLFSTTEYAEMRRILERRHAIETLMRLVEEADALGRDRLLDMQAATGDVPPAAEEPGPDDDEPIRDTTNSNGTD